MQDLGRFPSLKSIHLKINSLADTNFLRRLPAIETVYIQNYLTKGDSVILSRKHLPYKLIVL